MEMMGYEEVPTHEAQKVLTQRAAEQGRTAKPTNRQRPRLDISGDTMRRGLPGRLNGVP